MNLEVSLQGLDPTLAGLGVTDWAYLRIYLDLLVNHQITPPLLGLAAVGLAGALWTKDRQALYYLLLIIATYLFFTVMRSYRIDRYTIYWVPGFALFAALPFHYWRHHPVARHLGWLLSAAVLAFQTYQALVKVPAHTRGYQEAAQVAMDASRQGRIFMDGINNGYFTYFVRLNDPERRFAVLRGDKLLHSSAIVATDWLQVHVKDLAGIKQIFDQHGIDVVVIEERNYANLPIHDTLRAFLKTDAFELIRSIPVHSTRPQLADQTLALYRYKEARPPSARAISMPIPLTGMHFQIPLHTKPAP